MKTKTTVKWVNISLAEYYSCKFLETYVTNI